MMRISTVIFAVALCAAAQAQGDADTVVPEETTAPVAPVEHINSVIPKIQTSSEWASANEHMRAAYSKANALYDKANKEKFQAQGEKRKELNEKSQVALQTMMKTKESMAKKVAIDNPVDHGVGELTSADIANAKYAKTQKDLSKVHYGISGEKYTDGEISSDSYRDVKGHYLLGTGRRRVGAGFGRRRRFAFNITEAKDPVVEADEVEAAEKGNPVLEEGLGKPLEEGSTDATSLAGGEEESTEEKEHEAEEAQLPPGVKIADQNALTPEEKKELEETGAGDKAQVDNSAHFTTTTVTKILGANITADLIPPSPGLVAPLD